MFGYISILRVVILATTFLGLLNYHYSRFLLGPAYILADSTFFASFTKDVGVHAVISAGLCLLTLGIFSILRKAFYHFVFSLAKRVIGKKKSAGYYASLLRHRVELSFIAWLALYFSYFSLLSTGSPFFVFMSMAYLIVSFLLGASLVASKMTMPSTRSLVSPAEFGKTRHAAEFLMISLAFFAFFFSFHLAGGISEATVSRDTVVVSHSGIQEKVVLVGSNALGLLAIDNETRSIVTLYPFNTIETVSWASQLFENRGARKLFN